MAAAKAKGFEVFEPIFGEAKAELDPTAGELADSSLRPLLFYAVAGDNDGGGGGHGASRLHVVATDFHSLAWGRDLSVSELDDLRDDIGIGGSWSEFVDYLKSSLSVGEVKLILSSQPDVNSGLSHAKLVATKAKGLPRITISLNRLISSAANDAIAKFSLALYTAYRNKHADALKEQERSSQLMGILSSEREKNDILQKQLEALSFLNKRKASKPKLPDQSSSASNATTHSDQVIVSMQQQPLVVSPSKDSPSKVAKQAAPVSRRARVRGVLLQDTEDDK